MIEKDKQGPADGNFLERHKKGVIITAAVGATAAAGAFASWELLKQIVDRTNERLAKYQPAEGANVEAVDLPDDELGRTEDE